MEYEYERSLIFQGYDINYYLLDSEGNPFFIYLLDDINIVLPGKSFSIMCNGAVCKIIFSEPLTEEEKTILDTTVATYKASAPN